ncbi:hypothetical protein VP242E401_P0097 [Vibrio phage 242E40-1]|nr:hypothetical protein VP242E401_P0097 [Vibrio phage 242E40-1]
MRFQLSKTKPLNWGFLLVLRFNVRNNRMVK